MHKTIADSESQLAAGVCQETDVRKLLLKFQFALTTIVARYYVETEKDKI